MSHGWHGAQALSIGSRRQLAVSMRECGLCGGELSDFQSIGSGPANVAAALAALGGDATVQLSCKHCFHDLVGIPKPWNKSHVFCHHRDAVSLQAHKQHFGSDSRQYVLSGSA